MVDTLSRITTLLVALAILLVGHGLQMTLLPVHALDAGWTSTAIGFTGSAYFLGFVVGCVLGPGIVSRVGHIRSFMVMAAIATVVLLLCGLVVEFWAWVLFRFATGMALAGLYMIVESWLTEVCPKERRGGVLSVYLAVSLLGMALGQVPMMLSTPGDLRLFMLAAALLSFAIVPIGLTLIRSPAPVPPVRVTPATLLKASRVAVVCALIAGMVTGAFWTLGPVAARSFGLAQAEVGILMSLGVLGGAASQFPVGRLSDRMDRRLTIGALACVGAIVCAAAVFLSGFGAFAIYIAFFLLCAATMPVYALCIALAADRSELSLVELASGMLLANGFGSIVGPMIVAPPMSRFGPNTFFVFCAVCLAAAAAWTLYRYVAIDRPMRPESHAPMLPRTTQAVAELLDDADAAP